MRFRGVIMYERVAMGWNGQVGRGKVKGGKAGRAPGKELFASNVHTLFLLVEIGFCSALFNVWLQLGRISVGGMSDVEERMAVQEMMDGDVYLLTGACVEMAIALVLVCPFCVPVEVSGCAKGARA